MCVSKYYNYSPNNPQSCFWFFGSNSVFGLEFQSSLLHSGKTPLLYKSKVNSIPLSVSMSLNFSLIPYINNTIVFVFFSLAYSIKMMQVVGVGGGGKEEMLIKGIILVIK